MVIKRMTAKKVRISDLMNGDWVKKEGMEPSYIVTPLGEKVSRARILATVVSKFISEDENFASITLDDSTDTMRIKTFKTTKPIEPIEVGDLVDVIGKIREWDGEIYIVPEVIRKVNDPNLEILRRLEILAKIKELREKKNIIEEAKSKFTKQEEFKTFLEQRGIKEEEIKELTTEERDIKKEIIKLIEENPDGLTYSEILEKIKAEEEQIESIINELLAEGICYEPSPGKIKKI